MMLENLSSSVKSQRFVDIFYCFWGVFATYLDPILEHFGHEIPFLVAKTQP